MLDRFKVSFFVSAFLGGFVILDSVEARYSVSMNDQHEVRAHTSIRSKQPSTPMQKKLSPNEIASIMHQQILGRITAESEDAVAAQVQEIFDKASSPTLEQVKEIRALNHAFDKAIQEFIRARNSHRIYSRQKVSNQSFTRRPVSSKKINSCDIKRTHGTIRKATQTTRKFVQLKRQWQMQKERGVGFDRWASQAYGK